MSSPAPDLQRNLLVVTTAVAVVSDATLTPFYPQLFADSFGVRDPQHVGVYLAATCLVVMLVLPLWARLERKWSTLQLLCAGQTGAGLLAIACYHIDELWPFWACSLTMIAFKASYLLVYPYVMRLEPKERHARTIGLLTVIVHLGGVAGASIGGWIIEIYEPRNAFLWMAVGDFAQMAVSMWLVRRGAQPPAARSDAEQSSESQERPVGKPLIKLGILMVLFYFAVFVGRPFFVAYWTDRMPMTGEVVSGWVFAIPAWASLIGLAQQRLGWSRERSLPLLLTVAGIGLALQVAPTPWVLIAGRFVFGWAVFRAMVRLDVALFAVSPPSSYARDFSYMNLCQQGGVLVGFWTAGTAVAGGGLVFPLFVAMAGMVCVAAANLLFGSLPRADALEEEAA